MKEHREWILFRKCSSSLTEKERGGLGKVKWGRSEAVAGSGKAGRYSAQARALESNDLGPIPGVAIPIHRVTQSRIPTPSASILSSVKQS